MVTQKIHTILIAFFAIFVITNFNKATSLQCYQCASNSTGSCWSSPQNSDLKECGERGSTQSPSTTTSHTSSITISSSSNPTTTSTSGTSSAPTTVNTLPSSFDPTTTPTPGASSTSTTVSTLSSSPNLSTTSPTSAVTTVATRPSTEATTTPTAASSFADTPTQDFMKTYNADITVNALPLGDVKVLLNNGKNSRLRRDTITQADNNIYQCAKIIYKDGEAEIVERKCVLKTTTPCEENKEEYDLSVCEVCNNYSGCNTSSNISFGLSSMFIPFAMVYYMLSNT